MVSLGEGQDIARATNLSAPNRESTFQNGKHRFILSDSLPTSTADSPAPRTPQGRASTGNRSATKSSVMASQSSASLSAFS